MVDRWGNVLEITDHPKVEQYLAGVFATVEQYGGRYLVLGGEAGPFADLVAVNAGAAIMVAGLSETIADGIAKSRNSISSGKAVAALEALRRSSNG